jgi:hypothetical protein
MHLNMFTGITDRKDASTKVKEGAAQILPIEADLDRPRCHCSGAHFFFTSRRTSRVQKFKMFGRKNWNGVLLESRAETLYQYCVHAKESL